MNEIYNCFAMPTETINYEVIDFVKRCTGSSLIKRCVSRYEKHMDEKFPNLKGILLTWAEITPDSSYWHPDIGELRTAIKLEGAEQLDSMFINAGLLAHKDGVVGEWSFKKLKPTALWLDNWCIPGVVSANIKSKKNALSLEFSTYKSGRKPLEFVRENNGWILLNTDYDSDIFKIPKIEFNKSEDVMLIPGGLCNGQILPPAHLELHPESIFIKQLDLSSVSSKYEGAIALLRSLAPEYLEWVARVTKYISPLQLAAGNLVSGSSSNQLGRIVVSCEEQEVSIAEMMIHESSHQYFYLISRLGPISKSECKEKYYSPVARCERPIDMICLAFHAFANVLCFYNKLIESGYLLDKFSTSRYEDLKSDVRLLHKYLKTTQGLTEIGDSMWRPLSNQLDKLSILKQYS